MNLLRTVKRWACSAVEVVTGTADLVKARAAAQAAVERVTQVEAHALGWMAEVSERDDRVAELRAQVAELTEEIERLRAQLPAEEAQPGEVPER